MTAQITTLVFVLLDKMMRKPSLCLSSMTYREFFRFAMGHPYMLVEKIGRSYVRAEGALSVLMYLKEMLLVLFADNLLSALRTLLEHV